MSEAEDKALLPWWLRGILLGIFFAMFRVRRRALSRACGCLLSTPASVRPRSAPRQCSVGMGLLSRFRRPKPCGTLVSDATPCCPGVHRGLVTRSRTHTGARSTRRDDVGRRGQVHGLGRPAPEQQGEVAVRRGRHCAAGARRCREMQGDVGEIKGRCRQDAVRRGRHCAAGARLHLRRGLHQHTPYPYAYPYA